MDPVSQTKSARWSVVPRLPTYGFAGCQKYPYNAVVANEQSNCCCAGCEAMATSVLLLLASLLCTQAFPAGEPTLLVMVQCSANGCSSASTGVGKDFSVDVVATIVYHCWPELWESHSMHLSTLRHVLELILFLCCVSAATAPTCPPDALILLQASWATQLDWDTSRDVSRWTGVACDATTGALSM